jgi:predicted permease
MDRLFQDLRFGLRILWRDRGFAATALLTLALCIGINAAIFAVVNSVLLRPLPVDAPERLATLYNSYPKAGVERASNGVPDYYDRLREVDAFEEQALYRTAGVTIGIDGDPQRVTSMSARPSLLRLLHVTPVRGRIFTEAEGEPGADHQVILTYGLWQQLYAGRDDAIGTQMRINGVPYTIVGVLPRGFFFVDPEVKLWRPVSFTPQERSDDARHSNNWSMVGRLKPGATVSQAQQQVDALNARNLERFPQFKEILLNAGFRTGVVPLQEDLTRGVRKTLYLLWGGVLFVLLIGGVNITNLVLVRSSARTKELATRHALGAALPRLTRQLLTETIVLTIAGGALGLLLGQGLLTGLTSLGLDRLPRGTEIRMDGVAVLFTLGLALLVGILVGLVPVLNLRHMNLNQAFREESRSGTSGRATRTVRRLLVATQIAFAFMLLVGAGLLLASFERVLAVSPGFNPAHVLTARVALPASRYKGEAETRTFGARLLELVQGSGAVQQAGITSNIPFGGNFSDSVILAEGYQMKPGESVISPYRVIITPGYFETMGIPLREGRFFTPGDTSDSPQVVVVDERLARRFWGSSSPIGRRMYQPDSPEDLIKPGPKARFCTVVGVVGEIRMAGLVNSTDADDRVGAYYFPFAQHPQSAMTLAVRTAGEPSQAGGALRAAVRSIDPELPLFSVMSMEERMSESLTDRRTPMVLALAFAVVALFLAAVGIYGVLAFQVTQRTREIGIRMALGSDARGIAGLVLREGLALLAAGLGVGLVGAFAIRRAMETQLYGVTGMDPTVIAAVGGVLGLVAVIACLLPARRAAQIDPMTALAE